MTTCLITRSTSPRITTAIWPRSSIDTCAVRGPIVLRTECLRHGYVAGTGGMSTLYVLVPVTHMHPNVDWSVERDRFRERVLCQLSKVGFHDLTSRIRFEQVITPADWDAGHQIHLGATFNLAHNLGQMLHLRPQNRFKDLTGVYLVGGGTHPGSGLPVIYESARITSKLIMADLGLSDLDFEMQHPPVPHPHARPARKGAEAVAAQSDLPPQRCAS